MLLLLDVLLNSEEVGSKTMKIKGTSRGQPNDVTRTITLKVNFTIGVVVLMAGTLLQTATGVNICYQSLKSEIDEIENEQCKMRYAEFFDDLHYDSTGACCQLFKGLPDDMFNFPCGVSAGKIIRRNICEKLCNSTSMCNHYGYNNVCYQQVEPLFNKGFDFHFPTPDDDCIDGIESTFSTFGEMDYNSCCRPFNMALHETFPSNCSTPAGEKFIKVVNNTLCPPMRRSSVCFEMARAGIDMIQDEQCKQDFERILRSKFVYTGKEECCDDFSTFSLNIPSCGDGVDFIYQMVYENMCNSSTSSSTGNDFDPPNKYTVCYRKAKSEIYKIRGSQCKQSFEHNLNFFLPKKTESEKCCSEFIKDKNGHGSSFLYCGATAAQSYREKICERLCDSSQESLLECKKPHNICYNMAKSTIDKIDDRDCKEGLESVFSSFGETYYPDCCDSFEKALNESSIDIPCGATVDEKHVYINVINDTFCFQSRQITNVENVCTNMVNTEINNINTENPNCGVLFKSFLQKFSDIPNLHLTYESCCALFGLTPVRNMTSLCGRGARESYNVVHDKLCTPSAASTLMGLPVLLLCSLLQILLTIRGY